MKKTLLIILAALFVVPVFGQSKFYNKYAAYEGMTKVYISPSMFSLMGDDAQLNVSEDVDISGIIKNLKGLYILSTDNPKYINEMEKDFNDLIRNGQFEILMEVEETTEKVVIYLQRKDTLISDIYICARENDEINIICLTGEMTKEDLKGLMKNVN
ncbi:MAG: DUF4252 domain-containing protein [Bacteroidales bacterium]|jgi:hypothetical protein